MTPLVLVVVGTDSHPFDRLMAWLERWYHARAEPPAMLVQYGRSRPPDLPGGQLRDFLDHPTLRQALAEAATVVSHGGPATIAEARRAGHLPLVVARDPVRGEHVDDHQQRFAGRLHQGGLVALCRTAPELAGALDARLADPAAYRLAAAGNGTADRLRAVTRVGRIVEDLVRSRRGSGGSRPPPGRWR